MRHLYDTSWISLVWISLNNPIPNCYPATCYVQNPAGFVFGKVWIIHNWILLVINLRDKMIANMNFFLEGTSSVMRNVRLGPNPFGISFFGGFLW